MVQLSSYSPPVQGIQHTEENVQATAVSSDLGLGTLYITESNVLWLNSNSEGIQLEYKLISLHAISRDLQNFPKEHLLLHYDAKLLNENDDSGEGSEESDDEGQDEACLSEVRFAPESSESLNGMFSAMSNCQVLHPDSDCQLSDEDAYEEVDDVEGDGFFNTADGFDQLNEEGQGHLARFNAMLNGEGDADLAQRTQQLNLFNGHHNGQDMDEEEQFEDADDMDGR